MWLGREGGCGIFTCEMLKQKNINSVHDEHFKECYSQCSAHLMSTLIDLFLAWRAAAEWSLRLWDASQHSDTIPCSQFPAWCTRSCVLSIQNFPKAWHEAKWQALFLQLSSLKYYFYFARRKAWSAGIGKWWKKLVAETEMDNCGLWNPWCWRSESSAAVMLWLL